MMSTLVRRTVPASAVLTAFLLSACADHPFPASSDQVSSDAHPRGPALSRNVSAHPWSAYDEIHAGQQAPEPDDGYRKRCPEEYPVRGRVWKITLLAQVLPGINDPDYLAHFDFEGDKFFIGYVGRADNGDPLADYRYYETVYSHDRRYRAEPYGRLTLMCNGRYTRVPAGRIWSGRYTVVAHEGEITFGPAYAGGGDLDPNHCSDTAYMTGVGGDTISAAAAAVYAESYDPYAATYECGSGGGGGSGNGSEGSGATFAETCGAVGGKLYYDYICLEVWNQATGQYETVWCGTAAICET